MCEDRELFGETAEDGWEHDVWLMARRAALIYYYMATAIVERLGEEEGRKLVKEAIWNYGRHCGHQTREKVKELGLPLDLENFRKIPDLPSRGWRFEKIELPDGTTQRRVKLCPLARTMMDVGMDMSLARLYCWVDQSKIEGYNDDYECVHAHNVLDGDDFCEVVFQPKEDDED